MAAISRSSSSSLSSLSSGTGSIVHFGNIEGTIEIESGRGFEASTKLGLRDQQEDRVVVCAEVFRHCSALGLFDGTVGDSASDHMQKNLIDTLSCDPDLASIAAKREFSCSRHSKIDNEQAELVERGLRRTFHALDESYFIKFGADIVNDYTCSTGVIVLLWDNLLTVAHVGDSRACMGRVSREGSLSCDWLTIDHKPNMTVEKQRILECGGSVVKLHGNKPYIHGGDFFYRHKIGHRPKQLNYSRAFGGKGLKKFGLIVDPDISQVELSSSDKFIIIGSDGLWDCVDPLLACQIVRNCHRHNLCAADFLTQKAIELMPLVGVSDNVSAIVYYLNDFDDEPIE